MSGIDWMEVTSYLNCYDTVLVDIYLNGPAQIFRGWALDKYGRRCDHTWAIRDGQMIDHFGWTNHKVSITDIPYEKAEAEKLIRFLEDRMVI